MTLDLETLNPGIRRVVALLNGAGFVTTDSGDGETHEHAACDRELGYVVVDARDAAAADCLENVAIGVGLTLGAAGVAFVPIGQEGGAWIQATYDPIDGSCLVDVSNIHDRMLKGGAAS